MLPRSTVSYTHLDVYKRQEVLDINENTAKTRLYKALRLLKEDMVDYYE